MTTYNGFKVAALAASIAFAMGSTAVMAATDPAANQLPGQGHAASGVVTGTATITVAGGISTLTIPLANDGVITWKNGTAVTDINPTGTGGFNIGSDAKVVFTGTHNVLNIDSTGNSSQIFGAIEIATGNVFVANENGIIVGAGASISSGNGAVGLIANTLDVSSFGGTLSTVKYNGTSTGSGDVTVQTGATIKAGSSTNTVLLAGAGTVNVDLGAVTGKVNLSAGVPRGGGAYTATNPAAAVNVTGSDAGKTIDSLSSAGTATTNGKLTITASAVDGVLTNNGDLTLPVANGAVVNQGKLTTGAAATFASLTNAGAYGATTGITISSGGNLTNTGSITLTGAGTVAVSDGYINNSGSIAGVTSLATQSNSAGTGFTAGGQDYINNTGTITSAGNLTINANTTRVGGTANDSTGSFTNTGTLNLGTAGALTISANNNVSLGGTLKAGATPAALSATNRLGAVALTADTGRNETGTLSVLAPVFYTATGALSGAQVKLMNNVNGGAAAGSPTGALTIKAGAAQTDDYAVRVASGKTASGATISVLGYAGDSPNTILQGTLSAATGITFGAAGAGVGDIISGPAGGMTLSGATPTANLFFNGRIKTAPYLNDPNNFRYNYLPISAPNGPLTLNLNPVSYTTNGTSNGLSGVNILVNGGVVLGNATPTTTTVINGAGSAVTGVANVPNTHVVLQSTGNISTGGAFYWPGYVYLGTIGSTTAGAALPGTLSAAGKITLGGNFSNVLPGDVAGASGIHFMTGNALGGAFNVTTNANALVNFATDLLTQNYAQGLLTDPKFFGGVATGLIVNYGKLDASMFNTHPVDATK